MHADAGDLARRKESWHDVAAGIGEYLCLKVRRHTTHRVVRRWLHWHRLADRLNPLIHASKVGDVRQLLFDDLSAEVSNIEMDVVLAADPAASTNLFIDRSRDHVAWCQLHQLRRIVLHEALPLVVDQVAALAARRLAQQDADADDAGWVELVELHVLERHTVSPGQRHAIASE